MPSVHDVATYLLRLADRDRIGIDHLKLQKLVYYAQAFHLGSEGTPLFPDRLHAWRYGPVSPDLWSRYRYRRGYIAPPTHPVAPSLSHQEQDVVELVYERFRESSGSDLVRRTHSEAPWRQAMERSRDGGSEVISHESMRAYFRDRLDILAETSEFPPFENVVDLGSLDDVAAGILPDLP